MTYETAMPPHWVAVPLNLLQSAPERTRGRYDDIWIGVSRWNRYQYRPGPNHPIPLPPSLDEPIKSVRRRGEKAIGKVAALRDPASPHPAIREIIKDETARAEKVTASQWMTSYYAPRFTAPIDQRRLRILNAVCIGLAKVGLRATLSNK